MASRDLAQVMETLVQKVDDLRSEMRRQRLEESNAKIELKGGGSRPYGPSAEDLLARMLRSNIEVV